MMPMKKRTSRFGLMASLVLSKYLFDEMPNSRR